jgi:hypothetical protein
MSSSSASNPAASQSLDDGVDRPHAIFWVSIIFGMSLVSALAVSDRAHALWTENLGSFPSRPLIVGIFVAAWMAHVSEALYARKLCQDLGITANKNGWTLQTFLLGYPSLRLLLLRKQSGK